LPTQEKKQLRKEITKQTLSLIKETKAKIILMGDLNSTPNLKIDRLPPKKSSTPESDLLKYLKQNHYYDTFRLFYPNIQKFIYSHRNSSSRIDQIWTNIHITLLDYTDILDNVITDSNHNIITLEITLSLHKSNYQNFT
jgi:exonuclease III